MDVINVPPDIADYVTALNDPHLYVIPKLTLLERECSPYLRDFSAHVFCSSTQTYNQFLERLRKSLNAGLVIIAHKNTANSLLTKVVDCLVKILDAKVVVKPVLSHRKLDCDVYRVTGMLNIDNKPFCIAENSGDGVVRVLICPMPPDLQNASQCYVVLYDGVYYCGDIRYAKKHLILYAASKLCRQVVTADDIKRHFDVCIKIGYLRFSDGWAIGDGSLSTARAFLKYCYLPRLLLHRFFVGYLLFRRSRISEYSVWLEKPAKGVVTSKIALLDGTTAALGNIKATFSGIEWQGSLPLKIHVNGVPVYTCDLSEILLTSYNFTSQNEFNNFLQDVSKKPLFLRRFLSSNVEIAVPISNGQTVVELPVSQCGDNEYDIAGIKCTLDNLAHLTHLLYSYADIHDDDILKLGFLGNSPFEQMLKEVAYQRALRQYHDAKVKAITLLQELLSKYKDRLSPTLMDGKEGILVKGRKHTYFVELSTAEAWLVHNNTLTEAICIVERMPKHYYFVILDKVIARIVALLNDDVVAQHIDTLETLRTGTG